MFVHENLCTKDNTKIKENLSKEGIGEKSKSTEHELGIGIKCVIIPTRETIYNALAISLKKDLEKLKHLKKMKQPSIKVSDRDKLKGKNKEVKIMKHRHCSMQQT